MSHDVRHDGRPTPHTRRRAALRVLWVLLGALAAMPPPASAQVIGISLTFQSVAGGVSLSGSGTNAATMNVGTVSAFGSVPAGLTRVRTSSDYTLSTKLGVAVTKALVELSSNYTLRARLVSANSLTWRVNGTTMTTGFANVATLQNYATTYSHDVDFTIPFSAAAGSINTQLEVLAIAN